MPQALRRGTRWVAHDGSLATDARAALVVLMSLCLVATTVELPRQGHWPWLGALGVALLSSSAVVRWRIADASATTDVVTFAGLTALSTGGTPELAVAALITVLPLRAMYGPVRATLGVYVGAVAALAAGLAVSGRGESMPLVLAEAVGVVGVSAVLSLMARSLDRHEYGGQARLAALVEASSDVLLVIGDTRSAHAEDAITYASPAMGLLVPGFVPGEPTSILDIVHPYNVESLTAAFTALRLGELDTLTVECRVGSPSAGWRDVELAAHDHRANPHVRGLVCTVHDLTERNNLHFALLEEALRDPLTLLPNRAGLTNRLERRTVELAGGVLVLIDLEGTRRLSEYLGHEVGDSLLMSISAELIRLAGPDADIARVGDDEFAIVLSPPCEDPLGVTTRIIEGFGAVALANAQITVKARAGFARMGAGSDGLQVLRDATIALAEARRTDVPVLGFENHMRHDVLARLDLEADLRSAIGTEQIELAYQPVVSLTSSELTGVEALVRWRRPGHGVVPPAAFVPVAEATGLIVDLGGWVMREACRQAGEWLRAGHEVRVAVNVAAAQLDDEAFPEVVATALLDAGLPPRLLVIEVTESTVVQSTLAVAEVLARLRSLGIGISLDDFGTGYSSLSYLHHLPVDTVKIDQSFVRELGRPGDGADVLVRSIVNLARSLGLATIAEGIETEAQRATLTAMGAERGQGYLFDRPLSGVDLALSWLSDTSPTPDDERPAAAAAGQPGTRAG